MLTQPVYKTLIIALFIIYPNWKQIKYSSTYKWIKKLWYIYTVEYYSVIKVNEFMLYAKTWLNLKGNVLSERSMHTVCFPFYDIMQQARH